MNVDVVVPRFDIQFPPAGALVGAHNPADATTYFFGMFAGANPSTTTTVNPYVAPAAGRVIGASILTLALGILGTAEDSTFNVRLNNTSDTVLSSTVKFNAASQRQVITGLSLDYAADDRLEIKFTTPTWATNPTACIYQVTLLAIPR